MPKVLVIDDAPALRSSLCRVLRKAGYEAVSAADGLEATVPASQRKEDGGMDGVVEPRMAVGHSDVAVIRGTSRYVGIHRVDDGIVGDIQPLLQVTWDQVLGAGAVEPPDGDGVEPVPGDAVAAVCELDIAINNVAAAVVPEVDLVYVGEVLVIARGAKLGEEGAELVVDVAGEVGGEYAG